MTVSIMLIIFLNINNKNTVDAYSELYRVARHGKQYPKSMYRVYTDDRL